MGLMRSELHRGGSENGDKLNEVTAALNWHRFAPAFANGTATASSKILSAQHTYGETWVPNAANKTVTQSAPAIFARNTSLPTVLEGEDHRYITASQNPDGAYSIASVPRPMADGAVLPPPTVECYPDPKTTLIGVFGEFAELRVAVKALTEKPLRILAQDLTGAAAQEITDEVAFENGTLCFQGATLARVCTPTDASAPALAITWAE